MAETWPRAVVFDLDGTLVDTAGDIADVLNAVLTDAGLAAIAESEVRTMIGGGARKLVERALAKLTVSNPALLDRLTADFVERYAALGTNRSTAYPGIPSLLQTLSRSGIGLGVCTNKPAAVTARVLAALGLAPFFAAVVGETEAMPKKPHPAMLNAVLEALGVAPSAALMVGDSAIDVATARAAGVPVVLVSYGYTTEPASTLGADAVIDDVTSLPAVLSTLVLSAMGRTP